MGHDDNENKNLPELHRAAKDGLRDAVRRLLRRGEPVDLRNADDETPLMLAAMGGIAGAKKGDHRGVVADLLAEGAEVNAADGDGWTPLFHAVDNCRDGIAADLLNAKPPADPNAADNEGKTALAVAAAVDSPDKVELLVKKGGDVNHSDKDGWTALHYAARCNHPAAVCALVKHGSDVNLADANGSTALHIAASFNAYLVAWTLIDSGANLNATDLHGNAPLHIAAQKGHAVVVKFLIDAKAKLILVNKWEETPLRLAQEYGNKDAVGMLIDADTSVNTPKAPESENIAQRVFKRVSESIVLIRTPNGVGSGVIIAPDIVMTNHHVVEHAMHISVESSIEKGFLAIKERRIAKGLGDPAKVRVADEKQDFCLLDVPGLGGDEMMPRPYHTLLVGEEVYAIGNPQGVDLTLSGGVISSLRTIRGRRWIQTNAAISKGSSGGGLFDKNGNLIGITARGLGHRKGVENLNFAVPADLLLGFLRPLESSAQTGDDMGSSNHQAKKEEAMVEIYDDSIVTGHHSNPDYAMENMPCTVKITEGKKVTTISLEWEVDGVTGVYKGHRLSDSGLFQLQGVNKDDEGWIALFCEFPGDILVGTWRSGSGQEHGLWEIQLRKKGE